MRNHGLIIYDGDCIFCKNYVKFLRLRDTVGNVELLDARSDDIRVEKYWRQGFDLNAGMLFVFRENVFHGADAMYALARLSSQSSFSNRFYALIFSNKTLAFALYPIMKIGRAVTLVLRGRKQMNRPPKEG